jgi:hypothetical protein
MSIIQLNLSSDMSARGNHAIIIDPPKVNKRHLTVQQSQARCTCGRWNYKLKSRCYVEEKAMWNNFEFHLTQEGVRR